MTQDADLERAKAYAEAVRVVNPEKSELLDRLIRRVEDLEVYAMADLSADEQALVKERDSLRSRLEEAEKALTKIAKPSLGGKQQQLDAQEALRQIKGLA